MEPDEVTSSEDDNESYDVGEAVVDEATAEALYLEACTAASEAGL